MWLPQRDYKRLGQLLASAREEVGTSQQVLAKRLRKPQSFVSSYERGQRRVDVLEFVRILAALGVDPEKNFLRVMKLR